MWGPHVRSSSLQFHMSATFSLQRSTYFKQIGPSPIRDIITDTARSSLRPSHAIRDVSRPIVRSGHSPSSDPGSGALLATISLRIPRDAIPGIKLEPSG